MRSVGIGKSGALALAENLKRNVGLEELGTLSQNQLSLGLPSSLRLLHLITECVPPLFHTRVHPKRAAMSVPPFLLQNLLLTTLVFAAFSLICIFYCPFFSITSPSGAAFVVGVPNFVPHCTLNRSSPVSLPFALYNFRDLIITNISNMSIQCAGSCLFLLVFLRADLSDNPIGAETSQLLHAIRDHPTLQIVKLCNINAPSDSTACNAIRSLFASNPRIVSFDIHHNYFHHEALCRFFISLREAPKLQLSRLDLDSMGVGSVSMKDLVSTLNRCPQLSFVSLRKNAVGGAPLSVLLKGLRANSRLTSLNLARTKLRDSDIRSLGEFLRESRACLRELDISDNGLKSAAMDGIVSTWNRNKSLSTLWIGQNDFSPNDISRFLSWIASVNKWRYEYFSNEPVEPVFLSSLDMSDIKHSFKLKSQAQDLSDLMANPYAFITRLILVNVGFTPDSSKALVQGVKLSKTLEFVDIRFSELALDVMNDLALHYSISPTMSRLLIDYQDPKKLLKSKYLPSLKLAEMPDCVLHATHLVKLSLKDNRLTTIPDDFTKLVELTSLDLRNNFLEFLPSQMGWMTHLKKLKLDGNPLRTPPPELRATAGDKPAKILGYLRDLSAGQETIYRAKLMLVGQENVGKTSLLAALRRKLGKTSKSKSPKVGRTGGTSPSALVRTRSGKFDQFVSTDGIDIHELQIEAPMPVRRESASGSFQRKSTAPSSSSSSSPSLLTPLPSPVSRRNIEASHSKSLSSSSSSWNTTYEKRLVTLSTWDFGGQAIYDSTHQFFLSDNAVFLLVWDLRFDEESSRVGFWLQSIKTRAKSASIILVGTHADEISTQSGSGSIGSSQSNNEVITRKLEAVRQKYRKYTMVKGVVAVNCMGNEISDLTATLIGVLQDLPGMGTPIPSSHLALARFIRTYRQATDAQREEMVASYAAYSESPHSSVTPSPHASPRSFGPSPTMPHALGAGHPPNSARGSSLSVTPASLPPSARGAGSRRTSSQNLLSVNNSPPSARSLQPKHPHMAHHQQFKHGLSSSSGSSSSLSAAAEAFSTPASLPYKTWAEFAHLAKFCNIADGPDLKRCVDTLNMMGDVVYFDDPKGGLDDLVILDSQFLTQIMATIITTKQNYVKNGVINFNDLRHIWKPPVFPVSIHPLLMTLLQKFEIVFVADDKLVKRLSEAFDVSPAIKNPAYPLGGLGVIPSLLPETSPPLDVLWGRYDDKVMQYDREYVFEVLPMGLFSRLLFRLLNSATDVLHCWRYGAIFLCEDSLCLVEQNNRNQSVCVSMRGGRSPSEQLRIIADVIEALILVDTWWKTQVNKRIPCPCCMHVLATPGARLNVLYHQGILYSPRTSDEDTTSNSNPKGGSSDSIKSQHSKTSSGEIHTLHAPVPYHPGGSTHSSAAAAAAAEHNRAEFTQRARSTSTSPAQNMEPSPMNTMSSSTTNPSPTPAFRRGSSFNLRTSSTSESTPTKIQRRSQRAIRLSTDSSPNPSSSPTQSSSANHGADGGSSETLYDLNLPPSAATTAELRAASNRDNGDNHHNIEADAINAKSNRRAPSIGQIRMAKEKSDAAAAAAAAAHDNNKINNKSHYARGGTGSGSAGTGGAVKRDSVHGGSMSSFGASSNQTSSSENIVWGSSKTENEPCYFSVDDCIQCASLNQAYITCAAGHMVRLDRVAPDVALVDFERFRVQPAELELEPEPFAKGSYGLIFRAIWTREVPSKRAANLRSSGGITRDFGSENSLAHVSSTASSSTSSSHRHHRKKRADSDAQPTDVASHASSSEELEVRQTYSQLVAVKQIQAIDPQQVSRMYDDFAREVWTMSGLVHPNLVNLLGFYLNPMPAMLMEFVDGGDLYSFLHSCDEQLLPGEEPPKLSSAVILKIALDIANGMNFLHSATPAFIHRDLKSPNIMLTCNATDPATDIAAKVADFGLMNRMVIPLRKEGRMQRAVTNPTWQAPEILREEEFSEKSDTYAFGLILWELYTRRHPYGELNTYFLHDIEDAVLRGMRPTIPADCPEEYSHLIKACWADNPAERPSFYTILGELHSMIEKSGLSPIIRSSAIRRHKRSRVSRSGLTSSNPSISSIHNPVNSTNAVIPIPMPRTSSKRRNRSGSTSSNVSVSSVPAGSVAKPFSLPPKIDEVSSQEVDSPMESQGGNDADNESASAADSVVTVGPASTRSVLEPPRVSSVATMFKRLNSRRHADDDDDSEIFHDIEDSRIDESSASYHTVISDHPRMSKPSILRHSPSHSDKSSVHGDVSTSGGSASSLDLHSLSTPSNARLDSGTSSSSPMIAHPLVAERLAKSLSVSSTPGSSFSSQQDALISTTRPLLAIPNLYEDLSDEEEEEESEGMTPKPVRRGKSSSTETSSSSEDGELLRSHPALGLATAAVHGRFSKSLQTSPPTRLTDILQVGNSQMWATGRDGSVHIWNAKSGALIATHPQAHNGPISSAACVLDTVWLACSKTSSLGVWHVRITDKGDHIEKRSGTLLVAHMNNEGTKLSHWRKRFVVINFKDGSLKIFASKESKGSDFMSFDTPTPNMAPIRELSLINSPSNPISFGLALDQNQRTFKVTSESTTLFFEVEQENDMLEWLDCISSIASSERLLCLAKFTNEWTHNIGVIHAPSVKGELLITGSNDADMLVVSWNVQTKKVIRGTKLSLHLPKADDPDSSGSSITVGSETRSTVGSRRGSPEPPSSSRSSSSSHLSNISPKHMRIAAIVTLPKRGHTLVAAGPLIFVMTTKSLDVVSIIRTTNLERPSANSPIFAMALTRPKEIWTASKSGTITAWETSSFTPIARFQAPPTARIRCIMPVSSSCVWTSGDDGIIRIWDSLTHTLLNELSGNHTGPIRNMTIWHHSVWSASMDKSVIIWT